MIMRAPLIYTFAMWTPNDERCLQYVHVYSRLYMVQCRALSLNPHQLLSYIMIELLLQFVQVGMPLY